MSGRSRFSATPTRAGRLLVLAMTLAAAAPVMGRDARTDEQVRRLKAMHQEVLLGGAGRKIDAMRKLASRHPRRLAQSFKSHPPRDHSEALGPQGRTGIPFGLASTRSLGPLPRNQRISESSQVFSTQSEVSIAGAGSFLLAAWNDGGSVGGIQNGISFSSSKDGGSTWTQGGPLPRGGDVLVWTSDPVVTVDAKRGAFYVVGLVIAAGPRNGVGVIRGGFDANGFAWQAPQVARTVRDTFPDKTWMAADSVNGNVYLSYTSFFKRQGKTSDQIELQRSIDGAQHWEPAVKVSPDAEDGLVQGSRPVSGPNGELHVVWKTIDTTAAAGGLDAIRIRTSHDGGQSFGPTATVAGLYTNFCSGPPGFDRGSGLGFPSIAVDRGRGPHRGRLYVSWEESLDFYDDPVATEAAILEDEPDDGMLTATPFTLGESVHAQIAPAQDVDWYRFHGDQGQTAILYLDSLEARLDVALRLFCADGRTRLAYSAPLTARQRVLVFTLPSTGDYFVTVAPQNDSTGFYRLATGVAHRGFERGRDHRDLFVAHSDDGLAWTLPTLASDDPPGFDDWLPELAVGGDGKPYLAWYDWRDGDPAGCGSASNVALARSDDGGDHWVPVGVVTEVPTLWSGVSSNLVPNMGDYIGLLADERGVRPAWADGRNGDPDVYAAFLPLPEAARRIAAEGSEPQSDGVLVRWLAPQELPVVATAYRRVSGGEEVAIAELQSDAAGALELFDANVQPGFRYHYQLGVRTSGGETRVGEQAVDVPDLGPAALAIERLLPNPSNGAFRVSFRRPDLARARIDVIDVGGRRVLGFELGEEYGARGILDMGRRIRLEPGLYLVRLTQSGRVASTKAVVFR